MKKWVVIGFLVVLFLFVMSNCDRGVEKLKENTGKPPEIVVKMLILEE